MSYVCITDEQVEKDKNFSIFAMCVCQALNYQNEEKDKACFTFEDFQEFLVPLRSIDKNYIENMIEYLLSIGYIVKEEDKSYRYNFEGIKEALKTSRFIAIKNKCANYLFEQVMADPPFNIEAVEMYFRLFFYLTKMENYMRRNKHQHYYFSITSILRRMHFSVTQRNLDMCKVFIERLFSEDDDHPFVQVKKLDRRVQPYYVSLAESMQ